MGGLRAVLGYCGAVMGASWAVFRPFGRFGALLGRLGAFFDVWNSLGAVLGQSKGPLRPSWVSPDAFVGQLEALLGRYGPSIGAFSEAILGASWLIVELVWALSGRSGRPPGPS